MQMTQPNYNGQFKLLLLGDIGVGKTSIVQRYCDDTYSSDQMSTIGIDFRIQSINIGNKNYKLYIWDSGGHERFRSITASYYRGTHGAIFVYDITNPISFGNIKQWILDFKQKAVDPHSMVIIGNKSDLETKRAVTYEQGKELADSYGCHFLEISAKGSDNVRIAIQTLVTSIAKNTKELEIPLQKLDLADAPKEGCRCSI